jgi:hypothetical protein
MDPCSRGKLVTGGVPHTVSPRLPFPNPFSLCPPTHSLPLVRARMCVCWAVGDVGYGAMHVNSMCLQDAFKHVICPPLPLSPPPPPPLPSLSLSAPHTYMHTRMHAHRHRPITNKRLHYTS